MVCSFLILPHFYRADKEQAKFALRSMGGVLIKAKRTNSITCRLLLRHQGFRQQGANGLILCFIYLDFIILVTFVVVAVALITVTGVVFEPLRPRISKFCHLTKGRLAESEL